MMFSRLALLLILAGVMAGCPDGSYEQRVLMPMSSLPKRPSWHVSLLEASTAEVIGHLVLQPNRKYLLVLDLSTVLIPKSSTTKVVSEDFYQLLRESRTASLTVDVVLIPDEGYFQPQAEGQRVKPLSINLEAFRHLVAAPDAAMKNPDDEHAFLPSAALSSSSLGKQTFEIETKGRTGGASLALSIWVDNRPVDEISISVCIGNPGCTDGFYQPQFLKGPFVGPGGAPPSAAMHLLDLNAKTLVGVFRCNICKGTEDDVYRTWVLGKPVSWLVRKLNNEVLKRFEKAADSSDRQSREQLLRRSGKALYEIIFTTDGAPRPSQAEQEFLNFFARVLQQKTENYETPSLFVRLLPSSAGQETIIPLGLMVVRLPDKSEHYLGFQVSVETPLALQDYKTPAACISKWVLLVPPANLPEMPGAREGFQRWLPRLKANKDRVRLYEDLNEFASVLDKDAPDSVQGAQESIALLTLSHHAEDRLCFSDPFCEGASVAAADITRNFARPSLAIVNACGTTRPGSTEFIHALNERGFQTVIATSFSVKGEMAGRFLDALMTKLSEHAQESTYTLRHANFDAVNALSAHYGAAALNYRLLGNGSLRVCVPTRSKPEYREPGGEE